MRGKYHQLLLEDLLQVQVHIIKQYPGKSLSVTIKILTSTEFIEIFLFDPGADLEFHRRSGVVNCGPLTISAYKKLAEEVDKVQESLASITEE